MSSTLQARLKANLNVVSIFFLIATVFSVIRIISLINSQTFQLSEMFVEREYIPIMIQLVGFIAFIVSALTIRLADRLTETQQVFLFSLFGMALMPYTMILYIVGIMTLINDNRHRVSFYVSSVLGMILFGIILYFIFI